MLDQPLSERLRAVRESQAAPEAKPAPPLPPELPRRVLLGELLVEKGELDPADLKIALVHQRADGRPLGQILLEMGAVSPSALARTLTEQHGFDFSASLRRRLASVDQAEPEPAEPPAAETAEPEPEPRSDERYVVREPNGEPLHVADSFLDAADAAFELIDERDPAELEIVRTWEGEVERLWSYRRDDAADPAGSASDAVT
jgi:hypothetical protein